MEENYIVYVKTDAQSRIVAVNSSAFIADAADWTKIDEGAGDKYHHAQGNYFEKLISDCGIYNYKLVDDKVFERTEEEKMADVVEATVIHSDTERLAALEDVLLTLIGG